MKNKNVKNISLQRQEPRYCLFEEIYPTFQQLLSDIKREGFTEKRRVEGHLLSKLIFSQKGDSFIMILSELFNDSIVYVSRLQEKLGINQGTIQRHLEELKRFQVVLKTPAISLPGISAGLHSRLVFYHLPSITNDHLLKYVSNCFPIILEKYETPLTSRSMKLKCPECGKTFDNGRETCTTCTQMNVVYLIDESGKRVCPQCKSEYPLSHGWCANCSEKVAVRLVEGS